MSEHPPDPRRGLPSVSALLARDDVARLVDRHGREPVVILARQVLDRLREGEDLDGVGEGDVANALADSLAARHRQRVRRVVNATGVVLHTNLGRARLSPDAITAMVEAAGACTVEYDTDSQQRTSRGRLAETLLRELVGAEDALIVNNGAAALVLALAVVARGRRVAVSRGELIEIGGSFRLPAIMEAAGVGLVEVGTTNRTLARDYRQALEATTDVVAVLRVHPSNFRVEGFAQRPTPSELAEVAADAGVPFIHDVGSGVLHDDLPLPPTTGAEPSLRTAIDDGADLVMASGDKLLGGPQAGLLVGDGALVEQCRRNPLARALRADKLRLAALEATLVAYHRDALDELPTWSMLTGGTDQLRERAQRLRAEAVTAGLEAEVVDVASVVGGGSMPGSSLSSVGLAVPDPGGRRSHRLAGGDPPVIGRLADERLVLDLRTVALDQDDEVAAALIRLAGG